MRATGGDKKAGGTVVWTFHMDSVGLNSGGPAKWSLGPTAGKWLASLSRPQSVATRSASLVVSGDGGVIVYSGNTFESAIAAYHNTTLSLEMAHGSFLVPFQPNGNDYTMELIVTDTLNSNLDVGSIVAIQADLTLFAPNGIWPNGKSWTQTAQIAIMASVT